MDRPWQAIFLDLGGVVLDLASVHRARARFLERLDETFGVVVSDPSATWERVLGAYFREREGSTFRSARDGYERAVNAVVGEELERSVWWSTFVDIAGETLAPVGGAVETVRALDDDGYYLGLVSDIDTWEAEFLLHRFGLRGCFDDLTTSEEVGWTKPAPEIFEAALRKAGVDPGESLYVGDRHEHDMVGGKRAGLRTVAFGDDAADGIAPTEEGWAVEDDVVDFVIEDIRTLRVVAGVEAD